MFNKVVIYVALFMIYYHGGGLSTTNIIRLTKGNFSSILDGKCICDNCGTNISPLLQLPIISFIICKGKCKHCKCKIPVFPLILEFIIMATMSIISAIFKISIFGITLSYISYEIIRILVIIFTGQREKDFLKNYIIAVIAMVPFYLLTLVVSVIHSLI